MGQKARKGPLAGLLLGLAGAALGCARPSAVPEPERAPRAPTVLRAEIRAEIEGALVGAGAPHPGGSWLEPAPLADFYARRDSQPAWIAPAGPEPGAWDLLEALQAAARHGLRPDTYRAALLARRLYAAPGGTARELAELDLLASDAFLHLARHLSRGIVDPRELHPGYERGEQAPDPVDLLEAALAVHRVGPSLAQLAPPHPEYAHLMRALERLRASDPVDPLAQPGALAPRERVRANLERWRWLPRELGERHLRVNSAAFRLRAFEAGAVRLEQRVVVGCGGWETPPTHGAIRYLVLNPAWDVPRSIAVREMLPAVQKDPEYLSRLGIQVFAPDESGGQREVDPSQIDWGALTPASFAFQLRQAPGPRNPLGRIKFAFPNPYGIWLHGSPARASFERPARDLSHGCVRVEDEVGLALFALGPDPGWSRARLLRELGRATELLVTLPAPLPVHVLYLTAEADALGNVSFSGDPYGWDPALVAALPSDPDPSRGDPR